MKILDINELLQAHPYPGRGIVLGRSADGQKAVIIYFIMGRSGNSRNRVFEATGTVSAPGPMTRARWWTPPLSSTTRCAGWGR